MARNNAKFGRAGKFFSLVFIVHFIVEVLRNETQIPGEKAQRKGGVLLAAQVSTPRFEGEPPAIWMCMM